MIEPASENYCKLADGTTLCWRSCGSGPALILLHGWSMSSVVFSEIATLLAGDYTLFCPDLPGHGLSGSLPDYFFPAIADAVEQWVDLLGIDNPSLLGWSLGGQVALQIACRRNFPLRRLLLVSSTPCFCAADDWPHGLPLIQVRALRRNLQRAYEKTMGDFFRLQFAADEITKERYRNIIHFAVRPGRLPRQKQALATLDMLGRADLRSTLGEILTPTLITHGELDQIIPCGAADYLAAVLPNVTLSRFEQTGHSPFFSQPERCASDWRNFLQ